MVFSLLLGAVCLLACCCKAQERAFVRASVDGHLVLAPVPQKRIILEGALELTRDGLRLSDNTTFLSAAQGLSASQGSFDALTVRGATTLGPSTTAEGSLTVKGRLVFADGSSLGRACPLLRFNIAKSMQVARQAAASTAPASTTGATTAASTSTPTTTSTTTSTTTTTTTTTTTQPPTTAPPFQPSWVWPAAASQTAGFPARAEVILQGRASVEGSVKLEWIMAGHSLTLESCAFAPFIEQVCSRSMVMTEAPTNLTLTVPHDMGLLLTSVDVLVQCIQ